MNFRKVTIAGGGVLGSQIAFQTAFKGFDVTVWLRSEGSIGRTQPKLERLKNIYLATLEAMKTNPLAYAGGLSDKKDLTDEEIDALKAQVEKAYAGMKLTTSYEEAAADCDLLIESIAENPEEKIAFYTELAKHLPEKTVLATNSSTLLPSAFAQYTGRPEKYLALHFANEIWRFNTGEVMGHPGTDPKYYEQVAEFAAAIGMVPLRLHKEQPAYILNSLLVPLLNAAQMLLATDVASVEDIDRCWEIATGAPAGPFKILDKVGLTTAYNIVSMRPEAKDPNTLPGKIAAMLKSYIDQGKLGINAGEGFYKYK
ncbi:MAG: 3-hydroxyacyl-CoA dehydrogenase [Ruminococcaceae bacterium]|jgi:3-hydroxybutyryl-CoA dehydrogenase|nr:3-hydroxyacyl-CoA dehydrogenase [Oscillospiraceae bacterium]